MRDTADLYRAILDNPADDAARLIYADAIEETDPERAEFIRCQIAHSAIPVHECDCIYPGCTVDMSGPYVIHNHKCRGYEPQQRYLELWDEHAKKWFGKHDFKMDVVRGWPMRVSLPLALLVGGPCYGCMESGTQRWRVYDGTEEGSEREDSCQQCHGTGRTPGLARVIGQWPVTKITISCRKPYRGEYDDPDKRRNPAPFTWHRGHAVGHADELPVELFDRLEVQPDGKRYWLTNSSAKSALSAACLSYVRDAMGRNNPAPILTGATALRSSIMSEQGSTTA